MLDALDLRSNGLRGMTDAFRSTASSKNAGTAGRSWRCRCSG